jgi:hypothetical protein
METRKIKVGQSSQAQSFNKSKSMQCFQNQACMQYLKQENLEISRQISPANMHVFLLEISLKLQQLRFTASQQLNLISPDQDLSKIF